MSDVLLLEVLEQARRHGHLGPGPVVDQLEQARRFGRHVRRPYAIAVDLGAGGGIPGLVLATDDGPARWLLVDRRSARVDDLVRAIGRLGLGERVSARAIDAVDLGRDPAWRGHVDLVTARSLGAPPEVAELSAPLLRVGGQLLVSEPPGAGGDRWPSEGLRRVGLQLDSPTLPGLASFTQVEVCPPRYARRRRRSLW